MREVGKPAAIEIKSASRRRAGRISSSTDSRIWGFTARMTICACRAASSFLSVTTMPSSDASAAHFGGLGCEAIRFSFAPHPEARMPRRSAVPMFPAPITAILLATIFSPLLYAKRRITFPLRGAKIAVARCTRFCRCKRVPRPLQAVCRIACTWAGTCRDRPSEALLRTDHTQRVRSLQVSFWSQVSGLRSSATSSIDAPPSACYTCIAEDVMLALRLPPKIEKRLEALARKTGAHKSHHAELALVGVLVGPE